MERHGIGWAGGIIISNDDAPVVFDPVHRSGIPKNAHVFVSHAHADHTYALGTHVIKYATAETRRVYEETRNHAPDNFNEVRVGKSVKVGDAEVVAHNAGHMLGSAMFEVRFPEKTVVYTGDINCVDTLTTDAAEPIECDDLIVEATYGSPVYSFPERERTYAKIIEWSTGQLKAEKIPTFHVYAAGKAQEITRLFNLYTRVDVVTHPVISKVNSAYDKDQIRLESTPVSDSRGQAILRERPCVYITTPNSKPLFPQRSVRALATGWAVRMFSKSFSAFPLSSHADFSQLVNFVRMTRARNVYTITTHAEELAEHLRQTLGLKAQPIPHLLQKRIFEY